MQHGVFDWEEPSANMIDSSSTISDQPLSCQYSLFTKNCRTSVLSENVSHLFDASTIPSLFRSFNMLC